MRPIMRSFKRSFGCLALLGLAACNDHGDDARSPPPEPTTTVSGVAAVGTPIAGGQVSLHCADGSTASGTTTATGGWSIPVAAAALPCAVQVSGGTPAGTFYSIAQAGSGAADTTANITPATDLATAAALNNALGIPLDTWFAAATGAQLGEVAAALDAAISDLRSALLAAGYTLPANTFDPFVDAIDAGSPADAYDALLDAYGAALAAAGITYDEARNTFIGGGGLVQGGGPPPAGTLAAKIGSAFAGTYVLACGPKGATVDHTVVVQQNGSSTLDNIPVADAGHAGSVSVERTSAGFQVAASRLDGSADAPLFLISFGADGTIDSTSQTAANLVLIGGATSQCTGVSGTSNPAAYDHARASAAFALSQTLNCTATNALGGAPSASSPNGPTAFSIGTDGTYTLGALRITPADFNNAGQQGSYQADDELTFDAQALVDDLQVGFGAGADKLGFTVLIDRAGHATRVQYSNGFDIGTCIP